MFITCVKSAFRHFGESCHALRWLAGLAVVLAHALPAAAALNPELDKPYQVNVILQVAANRSLTPVFRDQLKRELADLLNQSLAGLAQVQVLTDSEIGRDLPGSLVGLKDAGPAKTHVVQVDFDGQLYHITAAQHDGLTGLTSPVVQRARTADRPLVGKLAAELVWRDFGPVGTVLETKDLDRVKVGLKAGQLPGGDRLVRHHDIFAIAKLDQTGGQVVAEAFLQVVEEPKDGVCHCQLLFRYDTRDSRLENLAGMLGYRCRKLCTARAPLRLRLVDDQGQPRDGLRVEVARSANQAGDNKGQTDRDGIVDTRTEYDRLAMVTVWHNEERPLARIPVPILDDRLAVFRVPAGKAAGDQANLRVRRRGLGDLINGQLLVVNQVLRDINELIRAKQHAQALTRAKEGRLILEKSVPELRGQFSRLSGEIVRLLPAQQYGWLLDDSGLRQLEKARDNLNDFIQSQEELLREQAKQQELQTEIRNLWNQARLARDQADYEEAIQLYQQALAKAGDHAKLAQELADLKAAWAKGNQPARDFIYRVWAKIDRVEQIKERLAEVRKHCEACQQQGDLLTLNKFLAVFPTHAKRLSQFLDNLRRDSEKGFMDWETYDKVAEELVKLHQEVSEYAARQAEKK